MNGPTLRQIEQWATANLQAGEGIEALGGWSPRQTVMYLIETCAYRRAYRNLNYGGTRGDENKQVVWKGIEVDDYEPGDGGLEELESFERGRYGG